MAEYYIDSNGKLQIRHEEKPTFFKKSAAFEDGYQVGDVLGTAWGTVLDAGYGVLKGAGRTVEGVVDLATYGVAEVSELLGANEFAETTKSAADRSYVDTMAEAFGAEELDDYSVLGHYADSVAEGIGQVALIIATGGGASAAGLGAKAITGITTSMIGTSSMGSGIGEARQDGATDGEAWTYGAIKGVVDAGTELIFGGMGKTAKSLGLSKGLSSLDDVVAKKLSSLLTKHLGNETAQKVLGNVVEYATKSGAEGLEELLAGYLTAHAKKGTFKSEEDFDKILNDENLLEQFIVGAIVSGVVQGGDLVSSTKQGKDFITDYTDAEQKVYESIYKKRIAERKKENGKVTAKDKSNIADAVKRDLERGYLTIDEINEALGGDSYKAYKSYTDSQKRQEGALSDKINGIEEHIDNAEDDADLTALRDDLVKAKDVLDNFRRQDKTVEMKSNLDRDVAELAAGTRLAESYREVARRREKFNADLSKYTAKEQAIVQKAIASGVLNNTNRTHDFVDFVARVSASKGIDFDFADNAKIKESGFAVDGAVVNGYVNENGITLNAESVKSLDSVVGHEITHVLEGTELYDSLKSTITEYAKSKGIYDSRLKAIQTLYEGKNADVEAELTADLVGDLIFTDEAFINRLTSNRTLFDKIFGEIKYLARIATAGSKEARQLEKAKMLFEKAYQQAENGTNVGKTKYDIVALDNGNLYVKANRKVIQGTTKAEQRKNITEFFNTLLNGEESLDIHTIEGDILTITKNETATKAKDEYKSVRGYALKMSPEEFSVKMRVASHIDEIAEISSKKDNHVYPDNKNHKFAKDGFSYRRAFFEDFDGQYYEITLSIGHNGTVATVYNVGKIKESVSPSAKIIAVVGSKPSSNTLSKSNIPQPNKKVNTKMSLSSDISPLQSQYAKADSEGNTLTEEQAEFFKDSKARDKEGNLLVMYRGDSENFTVFDRKKSKASNLYGRGFYFTNSKTHAGQYGNPRGFYLDIKNPLSPGQKTITKNQMLKLLQTIENDGENYDLYNYGEEATAESVLDMIWSKDDFSMLQDVSASAVGDLVATVELFNDINGTNYDGIIIPTETIIFSSEQAKLTSNTNPTSNPDIRYSLSPLNTTPEGKYTGESIAYRPKTTEKVTVDKKTDTISVKKSELDMDEVAQILDESTIPTETKRSLLTFIEENLLDKGMVFEHLSDKTGNRELEAKWQAIRNSERKAQEFINRGADGMKSLNTIRKEVEATGKVQKFAEYMYHMLNVDRMTLSERYGTENKPVFGEDVDADTSRYLVEQYEAQNPKFKQFAQEVYDYMNYLRSLMVDEGIITQETADLWSEMYPHYVPIHRADKNGNAVTVPLDTNRTGVNAPIKRAKGGNQDINPLFVTMAERTSQTFKAIAKNSFGVELRNTLGENGTQAASQDTDLESITDNIADSDKLLKSAENGNAPTFTVFVNGERVTFAINEDMYNALKPMSEKYAQLEATWLAKGMSGINNVFRNLVTSWNPLFGARNFIKDVQDVLLNSQHATATYSNIPKALAQTFTQHGHYYDEYIANGGGNQSYFNNKKKTFEKERSAFAKLVLESNGLGRTVDRLLRLNDIIEMTPRLAEYIASRNAGRSIEVSMLDAARVTTNFQAGADFTKFLNRNGATFLNASVQGMVQNIRNVKNAHNKGIKGYAILLSKFALASIPAMLLNHFVWGDDEEYEELSDYIKDNYYIVGKTKNGTFIRIPKGRTLSVIQNAVEQVANAATGNAEIDVDRFADLVLNNLAPNNPISDNLIAPIIQTANNKAWHGGDIVPTRLQDEPAAEQYDETTDAFSKWLGQQINFSPYKINYLIDQYSGVIGDIGLPFMTPQAESGSETVVGKAISPLIDSFTADAVFDNKNSGEFYDTKEELTSKANSINATDEDILKLKFMDSVNTDLSELYRQKREIQNSDLSDSEKYKRVKEIQRQINSISEEALTEKDNVEIFGSYAEVSDRQYRLNEDGEWVKVEEKQKAKQDKVTEKLGISPSEYWENKDMYDDAYDYPEKYAVSKAFDFDYATYKDYLKGINKIEGEKDKNGNTINGSTKKNVIAHIQSLPLTKMEKAILFKYTYPKDTTYNKEIIQYLRERTDISYADRVAILEGLGFTVKDGKVKW